MKLNNRGFAISSMLYSILLLFLMLIVGVLAILGNRKIILDKVKNEIVTDLTQNKAFDISFEHKNILLANTSKVSDFTFSLMDGVKVIDQNGNVIDTPITTTSSPTFNSAVNGTYTVTYTANYQGNVIIAERVIDVIDPITYEYAYTGKEQQFVASSSGVYRTELWGAQGGKMIIDGGNRNMSGKAWCDPVGYCRGGAGAYTSGDIFLTKDMKLYLHVGGKGGDGAVLTVSKGGYNGGGSGEHDHSDDEALGGGGGATDVRVKSGEWNNDVGLRSRIMVASGGAGAQEATSPAVGGSLTSADTITSKGATQTSGYQFGKGQDGAIPRINYPLPGAGSGYYGGFSTDSSNNDWMYAASAGSSYISGHVGSVAITSETNETPKSGCADGTTDVQCSYHYSGMKFTNTKMKAGNEEMPSHDGTTTMIGNTGDGYARVTALIIDNAKVATNLIKNSGYEEGTTNWTLSNSKIVTNVSKSGTSSLQLQPNVTSMSTQPMDIPIANHIYYGSVEFLSSNTFAVADNRFEWFLTDATNSLMVFARKGDKTATWKKLSERLSLTAPNAGSWKIRNFLVKSNEVAYTDELFIIDLTEIYGAGNEPSKEWCDENISYFDGIGIVPNY